MQISVFLHDSNNEIKEISVHKTDPVQVLQDEIKGNDKRFIMYKNSLLMTSFSFQYFGIKDGDHLYVLRTKYGNKKREIADSSKSLLQLQRSSRCCMILSNNNVEVIDKSALLECTRLLDLMYLRDDYLSPASRRGPEIMASDAPQASPSSKSIVPTVRLNEPSSEVLPIFWNPGNKRLLS